MAITRCRPIYYNEIGFDLFRFDRETAISCVVRSTLRHTFEAQNGQLSAGPRFRNRILALTYDTGDLFVRMPSISDLNDKHATSHT